MMKVKTMAGLQQKAWLQVKTNLNKAFFFKNCHGIDRKSPKYQPQFKVLVKFFHLTNSHCRSKSFFQLLMYPFQLKHLLESKPIEAYST